ncbi:hypothetical protein JTB14_023101 [Gonioctena quinquepunctata]|nr:hypothetical protein JTB14_023101 [Gonioctena quinquepunctata]
MRRRSYHSAAEMNIYIFCFVSCFLFIFSDCANDDGSFVDAFTVNNDSMKKTMTVMEKKFRRGPRRGSLMDMKMLPRMRVVVDAPTNTPPRQ